MILETFNINSDTYSVGYGYDNASNIVSMTYNDTYTLSVDFDSLNRIKSLGDFANFTYTADGSIRNVYYNNGWTQTYRYDNRGRPIRIIADENIQEKYDDWLDGWKYRKAIIINGSTAGQQNNYQMKITTHYGGGSDSPPDVYFNNHSRTDFGDVRFTTADGATTLDYWMSSKYDGINATFWVEVDSIPESNSVGIYIYYGNFSVATTSNGTETFVFFEDFEDGDVSGWHLEQGSGTFEAQTTVVKQGNYSARKYQSTGTNYRHFKYLTSVQTGLRIEYWLRVDEKKAFMSYTDGNDNLNAFNTYLSDKIDGSLDFSYYDGSHHKIIDASLDTWYEVEVLIDNCSTADIYIDGVLEANDINPRGNPTEIDRLWFSAQGASGGPEIYVDDYLAAKYVNPEPFISAFGSEEEVNYSKSLLLFYQYDKSGSVTQISDGETTETYSYDQLDRIIGSTGPWPDISYKYDEVGNRLLLKEGQNSTTYSYDDMNRLTQTGNMYYNWDANGNLRRKEDGTDTWDYTYDFENRLTKILKNGDWTNKFLYDARGRRVWLNHSLDGSVTFAYSGLNIISERDSSGETLHFYANGLHISENRSGMIEYFHQDHLGSTRLKTDENGTSIYETNYAPFGPSYGESGLEEFKYTGKQEDSSGLYYFGARFYDPEIGRFITKDVMPGSLIDPQSLNRYVYCRNNPLKYTDPDGRIFIAPWLANAAAGAFIGAVTNALFYCAQNLHKTDSPEFWGGLGKVVVSGAVSGAISGAVSTAIISHAAKTIASSTTLKVVGEAVGNLMGTGASVVATEVYDVVTGSNSDIRNDVRTGFVQVLIADPVSTSLELVLEAYGVDEFGAELVAESVSTYVLDIYEIISDTNTYSTTTADSSSNDYWDYWDNLEKDR